MKESVVLFGHGNLFERKIDSLKNKYDILAILDNTIHEKEIDPETGITIGSPENVKSLHSDKVVILSYAIGDMVNQMLSLGVDQDRIVYGLFESPRNSFEDMLYDSGNGVLVFEGDGLWYKNSRIDWSARVNNKDIRSINEDIKSMSLYPETEKLISALPIHPVDDDYGLNRGTPVDRYYIEKFLDENSNMIKGRVLEVGGRDYTLRFGGEKVTESDVIHKKIADPERRIFVGDLATGEGIPEETYDCFICTQTLPFIYDIKSAARNIVKSLKPGGSALVTAGGISQIITNDRRRYGHYWSFTDMSMENLFSDIEDVSKVKIFTYGNVKSAAAFLYGLSWEELGREVLDIHDPEYQVIVAAAVEKKR